MDIVRACQQCQFLCEECFIHDMTDNGYSPEKALQLLMKQNIEFGKPRKYNKVWGKGHPLEGKKYVDYQWEDGHYIHEYSLILHLNP